MFIFTFIFAIILGYVLKGRLNNLENINLKYINLVIIAFIIEFFIVMSIKNGLFQRGIFTYSLNLFMYILLAIFTYHNRENKFILLMAIGFVMNAIPIFLNGGAMPVSQTAAEIAGITTNVTTEGLYVLIDETTKLWFLGDIIPIDFIRNYVISIGDILSCLGLLLFIVTGMKKSEIEKEKIAVKY